MGETPDGWFTLALVNEIETTAKLSLIGRPDPESVQAIKFVADIFAEACWRGTRWVKDRDIPRIAEAFRQIAKGVRANPKDANRFPTPSDFMAAIPAVEVKQIEAPPSNPLSPDEAKHRLGKLQEMIGKGVIFTTKGHESPPDVNDKLARVNWSRKKKGLPGFKDQAEWDVWAAKMRARQDETLARMEHDSQ